MSRTGEMKIDLDNQNNCRCPIENTDPEHIVTPDDNYYIDNACGKLMDYDPSDY